MKILHVLDHSLPLHSGYSFRSENIIRCQQDIGLDVRVVTSPKHEESWKERTESEEVIEGIKYSRSGLVSRKIVPFMTELQMVKRLAQRIEEVVNQEKPDIIHAHSPVINALASSIVSKKFNIPVVYEIRAFWEDAAVDHGTCKEWGAKYRLIRYLETRACKKVDQVITICEGLRQDLIKRGISEDKVAIVPNAIDAGSFKRVERDEQLGLKWKLNDAKVLGFIGSFYHYEGIDLLLHAFAKITQQIPELRILLVGGGAMEDNLKKLAETLSIHDKVIFTGRLPHEQMPAMYSLIDILVLPRKSMRLTELVTPLKPLESMALEKLVLASDVGGHRELIKDKTTGLLFKAGSIDALAETIVSIFSEPSNAEYCIKNGFDWVTHERTWAQNAKIYSSIYHDLVNKQSNQ